MRADPLGQRLFARRPAPTPTPTPTPGITLDPAATHASIVLSNGNLTATLGAVSAGHYISKAAAYIPKANGDWYFEVRPSAAGWGLCDPVWNLDRDPSDFWFGKAVGANTSSPSVLGASGLGGINLSPANTSGSEYDGTHWFGGYIRRSGTGGAGDNVLGFVLTPAGWASCGDPNAGGAGYDLSAVLGGVTFTPCAWLSDAGDKADFKFGGAYTYAGLIGSPSNIA